MVRPLLLFILTLSFLKMSDTPMEEGVEQVVSGGSGSGSVSISIHPLVVMNVSDHFTRVKVQNDGSNRGGSRGLS